LPALKKLYPNNQDLKESVVRHNEFFNCHPYTSNAIIGVTLALEEQRAQGNPITSDTISSTKAALMGPLSGIGDSVFKATFMTIFAAIGAGLALDYIYCAKRLAQYFFSLLRYCLWVPVWHKPHP
jgi:PTS system mannose-specific IID component